MTEDKMSGSLFAVIVALAGIVGLILGIMIQRNKQQQQSTAITEFTRDEAGRILSILERMK